MMTEEIASEAERSLSDIVEQVFAMMSGIEMRRMPGGKRSGAAGFGALVRYSGPARGAIAIECSLGLAASIAARWMAEDGAGSRPADVQDSVGELVNMIGGNFKALLPDATVLSTPRALDPAACTGDDFDTGPALSLCFAASEGDCRVNLYVGRADS